MRQIKLIISLFIICIIFFQSCKSTNSPKAVTETFLVSLARLDIVTARNYSTKQTWGFLKVLEKETNFIEEEEKEDFIEDFKVTIINEKKINDSLYTVTFETSPPLFPFKTLNLVGEKNLEGKIRWKVDFNSFEYMEADSTIRQIMIPGSDPDEDSREEIEQIQQIPDSSIKRN
ncbi:MAG TPA: hypothetical protein VLZ83_07840 [Edaphocola sp.]|nr:hypothetical protein [Edaphocola sp.]